MALQKQVVSIPLVGGVEGNTETALKVRLDVLENGVYRKRGGISKRFGTRALSTAATVPFGAATALAVPETIAAYRDECIRIGVGAISTYSPGIGKRVFLDKVSECVAEYSGVASSAQSFVYPDVVVVNGYALYVYGDESAANGYGKIYATLVDLDTGASLFTSLQIESGATFTHARVIAIGTSAYVIYSDNGNIYGRSFDFTNIAGLFSARSTLIITGYATPTVAYDVCAAGSRIAIMYGAIGGASVVTFSTAFALVNAAIVTTHSTPYCYAITADATNVWVGYSHYDGVNYVIGWGVYTVANLTLVSTPTTFYTSASTMSAKSMGLEIIPGVATECGIIVGEFSQTMFTGRVSSSAAVVKSRRPTAGKYQLRSRPFTQDGKVFALVGSLPTRGGTLLVVDTGVTETSVSNYALRPVATLVPRQVGIAGGVPSANMLSVPAVVSLGSGQWLTAFYAPLTAMAGVGSIYTSTLSFNVPRQVAVGGNLACISGGVPSTYDGTVVVEMGYLEVPNAPTTVDPAVAGSLSAGAYAYRLVREWTDAKGNIHRSAPSEPSVSLTVAASKSIDVTFFNTGYTTRQDAESSQSPITNVLYRTLANGTNLYYRLTAFPPASTFQNNTTSTASVTYRDGFADSLLAAMPVLYTVGTLSDGTASGDTYVDNVCPPSARYAITHKNRFWLAGTDQDAIWYSKTLVDSEGPAFNEALTVPAFDDGRVTALATLDSALIVFKRRSIWILEGDGNGDTGTGGNLTEPRRISSDAGCIDFRSLVTMPEGLMFQSERGIYLLGRGLDVQFIGEDVADKTQTAGVQITSGVLMASQNQVRFTLNVPGSPTAGLTLVYDYLVKAWATFVYTDTATAAVRGAVSACLGDSQYWWITPEGQEYVEDPATYADGGTAWVTLTVRSAWLPLAGAVQGYQRVWRAGVLADRKTAHGVQLLAWTDYDDASVQTSSFTEAVVTSLAIEELELRPARQRCESFRFQFRDTVPAVLGTGQGATLNGITLEFGILPGKSRRLAAAQKG